MQPFLETLFVVSNALPFGGEVWYTVIVYKRPAPPPPKTHARKQKRKVPEMSHNRSQLHRIEERLKHILRDQVAEFASLLEVIISVLVLIGLVIILCRRKPLR